MSLARAAWRRQIHIEPQPILLAGIALGLGLGRIERRSNLAPRSLDLAPHTSELGGRSRASHKPLGPLRRLQKAREQCRE
jgi:hypothetical protein